MELTPNDIRNFEFPGKVRGYDKEAVDNFRVQVALTLENLKQENLKLTMEVESVKGQLTGLKQFEDAIKNAAIDARRNADSTILNAKKEAEEIVTKARAEADNMTSDLGSQKTELETQVAKIDLLKRTYLGKLQSLIQSHLEWVQELTKVELANQDFEPISVMPMQPPQQKGRPSDRLDVTSSSEITTKSRETIATQPSKERPTRTEEANAATRLVTVDQLSMQADQPKATPSIDPDLAAALNNYQHAAAAEQGFDTPKHGKDTARIEVPTEFDDQPAQHDPHLTTDRVSTEHYEHATVNIDTPITGTPIAEKTAQPPQDPNSLASVLDNVVHKFEEEMDKAAKS